MNYQDFEDDIEELRESPYKMIQSNHHDVTIYRDGRVMTGLSYRITIDQIATFCTGIQQEIRTAGKKEAIKI